MFEQIFIGIKEMMRKLYFKMRIIFSIILSEMFFSCYKEFNLRILSVKLEFEIINS